MTSLELSRRSFSDYDNDHSTEIFNSQEMRFCGGVKSIPLISRLFNQDYKSYPKAEHWTIKKKKEKKKNSKRDAWLARNDIQYIKTVMF